MSNTVLCILLKVLMIVKMDNLSKYHRYKRLREEFQNFILHFKGLLSINDENGRKTKDEMCDENKRRSAQ